MCLERWHSICQATGLRSSPGSGTGVTRVPEAAEKLGACVCVWWEGAARRARRGERAGQSGCRGLPDPGGSPAMPCYMLGVHLLSRRHSSLVGQPPQHFGATC